MVTLLNRETEEVIILLSSGEDDSYNVQVRLTMEDEEILITSKQFVVPAGFEKVGLSSDEESLGLTAGLRRILAAIDLFRIDDRATELVVAEVRRAMLLYQIKKQTVDLQTLQHIESLTSKLKRGEEFDPLSLEKGSVSEFIAPTLQKLAKGRGDGFKN